MSTSMSLAQAAHQGSSPSSPNVSRRSRFGANLNPRRRSLGAALGRARGTVPSVFARYPANDDPFGDDFANARTGLLLDAEFDEHDGTAATAVEEAAAISRAILDEESNW